MRYYKIDPDVPGRLAPETLQALRENNEQATIHYIFECWPDDDIVQADPIFLVSQRLADVLKQSRLTGFELRSCIATKGKQFNIASPESGDLPKFHWLSATGTAGQDDFGISEDLMLVVSDNARRVLESTSIENCDIESA